MSGPSYSPKVIAVDFDGTLCRNAWPEIGKPNAELIRYLRVQQAKGDRIILWTCRTDDLLKNAVDWCKQHGLVFDAVNDNLPERIAEYGNNCRKVSADIYLDDKNGIVSNIRSVQIDLDREWYL